MESIDQASTPFTANISKKNGNNKIQRLSFIEREHLNELKNKLCEKVFRDLSNKYYNLLRDKNYNIDNFSRDFEKEMEKSYDFNNPDYKIFFRRMENIFLNRMNKIEDKNKFNDDEILEREKAKSIKSKLNSNLKISADDYKNSMQNKISSKKSLENNENDNYNNAVIRDQIKMLYSPKKEELKRKQEEDEWAKIVNKDYLKFLEEDQDRKLKSNLLKKEYSNILQDQIKSKEILKKNELDNDKKFYEQVFLKNLKEQEKNELEKNEKYRRKCVESKLESMKELRDSVERKKKSNEEEQYIDKIINDYQTDRNRKYENNQLYKNKKMRKISQEFEEENKQIHESHKNSALKEKEEDKKYMKEYLEKLKKDDEMRESEKESIFNKLKSFTSQEFYSKFLDINDLKKKEIQTKNENCLSFIEKNKLLNENKLQKKLIQDIDDTKKILDYQIQNKKAEKLKTLKSNLEENVKLEEYFKQQEADDQIKLIKQMLALKEYREALDQQIGNKKKEEFMTIEERKINKEYM